MIRALTNVNPVLLGVTLVIIAGAAWTAWSEWTAAAGEHEADEFADFLAECETEFYGRQG